MTTLARTDTSLVGQWWWTIDRWFLGALLILLFFGILMVFGASPAVAAKLNLSSYYFIKKHLLVVPLGMIMIFFISLLSPKNVRRIAAVGLLIGLILLGFTLMFGGEIKGARRWLSLGGFSFQASEFIKPFFAVVAAWMFSEWRSKTYFPGHWISLLIFITIVSLLLGQPDLGQTVVIAAVWLSQFFLAGLPMLLVMSFFVCAIGGLAAAEFAAFINGEMRHLKATLDPNVAFRIKDMDSFTAMEYLERKNDLETMSYSINKKFEEFDIIITPTVPITAPITSYLEDSKKYSEANGLMLRNTSPVNLLGLCAITIPVALDGSGIPIGVQLIAPAFHEMKLLSIALRIENSLGNKYKNLM